MRPYNSCGFTLFVLRLFPRYQTALEEADDAMSFAKKAQQTASKAHVLSSRKNIDVAVARVAACEEVRSFP